VDDLRIVRGPDDAARMAGATLELVAITAHGANVAIIGGQAA
jgi:hypothetical protein